jgi:hypothetical protein
MRKADPRFLARKMVGAMIKDQAGKKLYRLLKDQCGDPSVLL